MNIYTNKLKNWQAGLFLLLIFDLYGLSDLEDRIQDFVLDTKKIEIPGFPNAFNASITRFNGALLLSFRDIPNASLTFNSRIGLVFLDEDFTPLSEPQLLETFKKNALVPYRSEDARLITCNDRLFLIYSDNVEPAIVRGFFRVYISELIYHEGRFTVGETVPMLHFEGESPERREKNWVPFIYDGELLLAYSLTPHTIFRPFKDGSCETIEKTIHKANWNWGELRGGTPALLLGDRYVSIFHSCIETATVHSGGKKMWHYFMGAYTFENEPPFSILEMSPEPIVGKNFYRGDHYRPYWKPVRVVFPCGLLIEPPYLWVVYGREDHEIWVAKMDIKGLQKSLVPVTPD